MFYLKNISLPHRLIRGLLAVLGAAALVAGLVEPGLMLPLGLGLLVMGLTGLVGWCPMCAMLDRFQRKG